MLFRDLSKENNGKLAMEIFGEEIIKAVKQTNP